MTDDTQDRGGSQASAEIGSGTARSKVSELARGVVKRLGVRRWLLGVALVVLSVLVSGAGLGWTWAVASFLVFAAAAAIMPRAEDEMRPATLDIGQAAAMQRDAERLSQILEAIPDPAILLTAGGTVVSYNARAARQYRGLRRGGNVSVVVRNPDFLDAIRDVGKAKAPITVSYLERVPIERRIDATLAALSPAGGAPDAARLVLACMRDLTEQERTNRMRQDFVANASHELRTPLASLIGFIETLQGPARKDAETQKRFLDIMAKQASRMTRLIDDLLSLSRVEMKAHLAPDKIVDVSETVRHVVDLMEPLAREAELELRLEGDLGGAPVRGERDELVQLFQNLIQNAIKYGAEGEVVTVALERLEGADAERARIAVSVIDRGVGIAPEHLPRLTERFYRVDVASSRDKGGTGLGLAIVKHIVNRHRGELQIKSQPGVGSTFRVSLPLAAGEGPAPEGRSAADAKSAV